MTFSSLFATTANVSRITTARPDLAAAGIDTAAEILSWYSAFGKSETSAIDLVNGIDDSYLLSLRPDVAAAVTAGQFLSATHWFLENGANDGLNGGIAPSATFNATAYLAANSDLASAGIDTAAEAINHFVRFGAAEGRAADGSASTGTTGTSFTLATTADVVAGTANNDTIRGVIDTTTAANSTLTAADSIAAAAGTDTLNLTVSGAGAAGSLPAAEITGVEVYNVRDVNTNGASTYDFSLVDGETTVNSDRSTQAVTFSNLAADAVVGIKGNASVTNGNTTFTHATAEDAFTINIADGVTAGNITRNQTASATATINSTGAANVVGTIDLDTATLITGLTINATTNLTADLAADYAASTAITVSGAATFVDLNGATLSTNIASVNASGLTAGGVYLSMADGDITVTGGTGNDWVDLNAVAQTATVALGAGTGDRVEFSASTNFASSAANVTGAEILRGAGNGASYAVSSLSGITSIETFSGAGVTFTGLTATQAAAVTVLNDVTGALTLTLATSTGTSDVVSVTIDDTDTTAAAITIGDITAASVETINIVSGDALTSGTAHVVSDFDGSTTATRVNVSGTSDLTLSSIADLAANALVDGSSFTKILTVTGAESGDTVKGGTAADAFSVAFAQLGTTTSFVGSTGDDTLTVTGNGSDIIDADFTAVTGIDNLVVTSATTTSVTLQGFAQTSLATVDANTDGNLDITAANLTTGGTINASALTTEGVDIAATLAVGGAVDGTATLALSGGAVNDTFTVTINDAADTGNDATQLTITTGNGLDIITSTKTDGTGAATDVMTVVSSSTTTANADIITGFEDNLDTFDYNGTLQAGASNVTSNATLIGGIAADATDAVYIVTTNIANSSSNTSGDTFTSLLSATASNVATLYDAFETQLLASNGALNGTITGLDSAVTASESVLISLDNGTGTVVVRLSNTTASSNTIEAGELELVAIFTDEVLSTVGDFV